MWCPSENPGLEVRIHASTLSFGSAIDTYVTLGDSLSRPPCLDFLKFSLDSELVMRHRRDEVFT